MMAVIRIGLLLLSLVQWSIANTPPDFTATMDLHVISEDTPVGTSVYTLRASDPDGLPLRYSLDDTTALSVEASTGVVTLREPLDFETRDHLVLSVTVTDTDPSGGDNTNVITLPITIIVLDANDNTPQFKQVDYTSTVNEDSPPGSTVLSNIRVTDVDQVGQAISVNCIPSFADDNSCSVFSIESTVRTATEFIGNVILMSPLSFARQRDYSFQIQADDGELSSTVPVMLKVSDVQNRPPEFFGSLTGVIMEDAPIGSQVMKVQAKDDDVGNPRDVMYTLIDNPHEFFIIETHSGVLRTAKPLDREALTAGDGVVRLMVKATEVNTDGTVASEPDSSAESMITVTIRDVNDEAPHFNQREYRTSVPENVPDGTPLAQLDIVVQDTDVGSNSQFALSLVDSSGKFSVEPPLASGSSSVSLRVAKGPLDYENPSEKKFILLVVATETLTKEKLSSTATVVVSVTDVNDNAPVFQQDAYTASVSEAADAGAIVISISATDRDEGKLGTQGVIFSLSGNGAEKFSVDPRSGVITVVGCPEEGGPTCLDYEARKTYYLSLQAMDSDGSENAKSRDVPVKVTLEDVNDNSPMFVRESYNVIIQEKTEDFDPPLIVKAIDRDDISKLQYSIVDGDPDQLFVINPNTGRITLRNPKNGLDISDLPSDKIKLSVEASDGVFTDLTEVHIAVQDANNHSPLFTKNIYLAAVQETAIIGSPVIQVAASDGDVGVNAIVKYKIQKGAFKDFVLDADTGIMTVAKVLDYDTRDTYSIEVLGIDGGKPQRVSTGTVSLSVVNNNDKRPTLTPLIQRAQVREDAPVGQRIHEVIAVDPDVTGVEGLMYDISSVTAAVDDDGQPVGEDILSALGNVFSISPQTGEVFVSAPLNREIFTEITLAIRVTDTSADLPQTGEGALVITLLDVNDFPPMFPQPWSPQSPEIRLSVHEELPMGTVVTSLQATDPDSNIGGYRLDWEPPLGVESPSPLSIDGVSGVVTVSSRLDYETMEQLVYRAVVWDTGLPRLTSTATFIVELTNLNDEAPVFMEDMYEASVSEHSEAGTVVTKVSASDKDKGVMGRVTYSLTGSGSPYFSISTEGVVTVAGTAPILDRESQDNINLRVVATDDAPPGDTKRQASVPLSITIEDINDHAPVFSLTEYTASVVENLPLIPPAPILQLTAIDEDLGENALIAYEIVEEQDNFRLDRSSGILFPAKPLVRQQKSSTVPPVDFHTFSVVATDRNGTGRSSGKATVRVNLLPQNQHKPRYISPDKANITIQVPENGPAVTEVVQVVATDEDIGPNGLVHYHLRVGDANVQETEEFSIDSSTGKLLTKRSLDREETSKYELVLVAKDAGSPISYETLRVLTILVKDEDDHLPQFTNASPLHGERKMATYSFTIGENKDSHTKIGRVTAVDSDADSNAQIYYHLLKTNEANSSFYVDKVYGFIYSSVSLDREEQSDYNLKVIATNSPTLLQPVEEAALKAIEEASDNHSLKSLAHVNIAVTDENDSPPVFPKKEYYAGVSASAEIDELVRTVQAFDGDFGINGSLIYSITRANLYKPGSSKSIGALVPAPFKVESSGRLVTDVLMTQYKEHRFRLDIEAREMAPPNRVAKTSVHVWVWNGDELVRVVLLQPPMEVIPLQDEIAEALSKVSSGNAVIDEIRYHTKDDNTVDTSWTDLLVHVVNSTGHVMPVDRVLRSMDTGYDKLTAPGQNFKVHNVYPALQTTTPTVIDVRLAGLIALLVVLFIGSVSFCVVCCCLRYWAMTPIAKSTENLVKRGIEDDIGLNKTENPLWLEQQLKRYEEQELSMHVMSEFDPTVPSGVMSEFSSHGAGISMDPDWRPDGGHHADGDSNAYATIAKSHGGTIRSMQLRNLAAEEGVNYDYYSTLEHLRRGGDLPNANGGPKVPGVQTPRTGLNRMMDGLEFTGSTFQASQELQSSDIASRPLPNEPRELEPNFRTNERGEPIMVAELI